MKKNTRFLFILLLAFSLVSCSYLEKGLDKKTTPEKKPPAQKKETETTEREIPKGMKLYVNARFGFSIFYPEDWTLTESQNGDGASVNRPEHEGVFFRAWGSNVIEPQAAEEMLGEVESVRKSTFPDFKTLERKDITLDGEPAVQVLWAYTESGQESIVSGPVKELAAFVTKDEFEYGISCLAPADEFGNYQQIYRQIINSFRFTEGQSEQSY